MSIDCDGTNAIQIPGPLSASANQSGLTAMCWVSLRNLPSLDNMNLCAWATAVTTSRFGINCRNAIPGSIRIVARAADAEALSSFETSNTPLVAGAWLHIAATINYATANPQIFVNAVSEPMLAGGSNFTQGTTSNTNSPIAKIGVTIANNTAELVNGLISDVRLYTRVLGAAEIMTIYTALGRDTIIQGLASRYPLNDLGPGVAINGVANIAPQDRVIGVATATPMIFGTRDFISTRSRPKHSLRR